MQRTFRRILFLGISACCFAGVAQELPAVTPLAPSSYAGVSRYLNPGGNAYVYLTTAEWGTKLGNQVLAIEDLVQKATQGNIPDPGQAVFGLVKRFVAECGLADLHGVGFSSVVTKPGIFHNRMVLLHAPEQPQGLYWDMLSRENKPFSLQDHLPPNTVMAAQNYADIKPLWSWITAAVLDSESAKLIDGFEAWLRKAAERGIQIDSWISSLGENAAIVVTVDPDQTITIPNGPTGQPVNIPGFAAAIMVDVRNDSIFTGVEALVGALGNVKHNDTAAMRSLSMMLPWSPAVQPTIARFDNVLVLSSSATLVDELVSGQGGLTTTELFTSLSAGLPKSGLGFSFISPALGEALGSAMQASMPPGQQPAMFAMLNQGLLKGMMVQSAYGVVLNMPDALVSVSNTDFDVAQNMVMQVAMFPAFMMAGVMVPAFTHARGAAVHTVDMNNLKQIGLGLHMSANDHAGNFPEDLGALMEEGYMTTGAVYVCPASGTTPPANADDIRAGKCDYLYFGQDRTTADCGPQEPMACTKPGLLGGQYINVLFCDGHVQGFPVPPPEIQALLAQ